MRFRMVVDVLINHIIRNVSTGCTKIPSCTKMPTPVLFSKMRKFDLNIFWCPTFSHLHKFRNTNFRWNLCKYMDVVTWHDTIGYRYAKLFSYLVYKSSDSLFYWMSQNFVAVLGNPNNMVSMVKYRMSVCTIARHDGNNANASWPC